MICEHEKSGFRLEKCLGGFRSCRPTTTSKVDDDDHERARERERESYAKVWYASFSAVGADTDTGTSIAKTNKKGHRIVKQVTHGSDFSYGETSREVKKERDGSQCRTHTLAMWAVFIYWWHSTTAGAVDQTGQEPSLSGTASSFIAVRVLAKIVDCTGCSRNVSIGAPGSRRRGNYCRQICATGNRA